MLVDDVVADADVDRDRHAEPTRRGQDADVLVREGPSRMARPERLAQAQALPGAGRG